MSARDSRDGASPCVIRSQTVLRVVSFPVQTYGRLWRWWWKGGERGAGVVPIGTSGWLLFSTTVPAGRGVYIGDSMAAAAGQSPAPVAQVTPRTAQRRSRQSNPTSSPCSIFPSVLRPDHPPPALPRHQRFCVRRSAPDTPATQPPSTLLSQPLKHALITPPPQDSSNPSSQ
jgi:hypothetical protein